MKNNLIGALLLPPSTALEGTITSSSSTSLPLSSSAAVGAFKVSHDSKPKVVAGAIAGRLRENKPTIVDAIGAASVNQAVKSIVIAGEYIAPEGFDAAFTVTHLDKVGPDALRLTIVRQPKGALPAAAAAAPPGPDHAGSAAATPAGTDPAGFKVAAQTRASSLAGAIAGKLRGGTPLVSVTAVGPGAVLKMTKALALAEFFLTEDGISALTIVESVSLLVGEEERRGLRATVYAAKKLVVPLPVSSCSTGDGSSA